MKSHLKNLVNLDVGHVFFSVPLKKHCTWKIGGPADALVEPQSSDQLVRLKRHLYENQIMSLVIGEGSNLLFDDRGFRGVVIKMGRAMSNIRIENNQVQVEAGASVARLARKCGLAGLSGIEHIVGIPGTLGGLVVMNGGSMRKNLGDTIESVEVLDNKGDIHNFSRDDCGFAYRKSMFQDSDWIILKATLKLRQESPKLVHEQMLEILRERRKKFPRRLPNCGSVFLSTTAMYETIGPPGKVIEEAGLKGVTVGGAQVSHQHANFIINTANATAADVKNLVQKIRETVHTKTGYWLACEVRQITEDGQVLPLDQCPFPRGFLDCFTSDLKSAKYPRRSKKELLKSMIFQSWYRTIVYYRLAMFFRRKRHCKFLFRLLSQLILTRLSRVPGVDFRSVHEIGIGLMLPHPHDIVLGHGSKIAERVTIYNGVTLGAKNHPDPNESVCESNRYPTIMSGVTIFTGAKILGPVTIGANSIVGANAVVMDSFPDNSVIAGIPAKLISFRK